MATKQLDALLSRGLIATLKYEMDMLTGRPEEWQKRRGKTAKQIQKLRELIDLACKAQRSHLSKAEKVRLGIK